MRVVVFEAYGVSNALYFCHAGEGLLWHHHKHERLTHGHVVLAGATHLEIEGLEPMVRTPLDPNIELAWDVPHQITALHDDTIFFNPKPAISAGAAAVIGGVMLVDGSVCR